MMLDRAAIAELAERIGAQAPDTVKHLQTLVDNFQIGKIQELLGEVK